MSSCVLEKHVNSHGHYFQQPEKWSSTEDNIFAFQECPQNLPELFTENPNSSGRWLTVLHSFYILVNKIFTFLKLLSEPLLVPTKTLNHAKSSFKSVIHLPVPGIAPFTFSGLKELLSLAPWKGHWWKEVRIHLAPKLNFYKCLQMSFVWTRFNFEIFEERNRLLFTYSSWNTHIHVVRNQDMDCSWLSSSSSKQAICRDSFDLLLSLITMSHCSW